MIFRKSLVVGLLSVGALMTSALPGVARPGTIGSEANLRSAASLEANVLEGLPVGTNVEVLNIFQEPQRYQQQQHSWYYLRANGRIQSEGWVRSELVNFGSTREAYGTLSGDRDDVINIRSAPTTQGKVQHTGIAGDLVTVGRSMQGDGGKRWFYVTFPNRSAGWVREDLISIWGD
jgi:Bacterial SH3 domain